MSCEAAAASSSTGGAGAPLLPDSELIKLCPMCRVPIEKDEGCAQMMCKRCKHVVGIFAGFGLLLLVASPLLLLAAPCIVCCKCRLCNPSTKNLEEVDEIESISPGREEDGEITRARRLSD
ncbi:hypothetical protein MSG28_004990 [Choristoneura fumiferana]|uniref:Uncharacterized protein n=1 Tax=Choristoneura fumiferana TaxID=7141 RepID=A0ACC0JPM6_CHOFU|nr:hypothetical protein MSG28_004990 [Choristoneura fumiferana]